MDFSAEGNSWSLKWGSITTQRSWLECITVEEILSNGKRARYGIASIIYLANICFRKYKCNS